MKLHGFRLVLRVFAFALVPLPLCANTQQDSLKTDSLIVAPNGQYGTALSRGYYSYCRKDVYAFQTYAGFNLLNTLRGHVPSVAISPNPSQANANGRLVIIDGIPFASDYSQYYNFNSFDYESVSYATANAGLVYGDLGSYGLFHLQSKSGRGLAKPVVEVNLSPTLQGIADHGDQHYFRQAIAYAGDYGLLDTRISYNSTFSPDTDVAREQKVSLHALRLNTGLEAGKGFTARLILDGYFNNVVQGSPSTQNNSPEEGYRNLSGNLNLKYEATRWLTFSSQSSLGKLRKHYNFDNTQQIYHDNNRTFSNLFATVNTSASRSLRASLFTGVQYEKQKLNSGINSGGFLYEQLMDLHSTALVMGTGLSFRNFLFSDFTFRREKFSSLPADHDWQSNYNIAGAFVFTEALNIVGRIFSQGKLRASFGEGETIDWHAFPNKRINPPFQSFHPSTGKKITEGGFDLGFFSDRLMVNATYSRSLDSHLYISDFWWEEQWTSVGELETEAYDLAISGAIIDRGQLRLSTTGTWSHFKAVIHSSNSGSSGGDGPTLGNAIPDWSAGLLNQISYDKFFLSFYVDGQKGGVYSNYSIVPGAPTIVVEDLSHIRFRDLSIGCTLPNVGEIIERATISLSGRNFWILYDETAERNYNSTFGYDIRSATLSITLQF